MLISKQAKIFQILSILSTAKKKGRINRLGQSKIMVPTHLTMDGL